MFKPPGYASQFAIVERVVQFRTVSKGEALHIRIEALKPTTGPCFTRVYKETVIELPDPARFEPDQPVETTSGRLIWADFPDAPPAEGDSVEEAIELQLQKLAVQFGA